MFETVRGGLAYAKRSWNFKRNLVDKLNSKMEVTEEQISDTEDNNRNYPVYNKDNVD